MDKFMAQAKRFGATIIEEWATDFKFTPGGPHHLKIGDQKYEAEAVILANGAAARWLNAPNEEKYRFVIFVSEELERCLSLVNVATRVSQLALPATVLCRSSATSTYSFSVAVTRPARRRYS